MDIKQLKPNKNSRYQQGLINPESCKKLFESQNIQVTNISEAKRLSKETLSFGTYNL